MLARVVFAGDLSKYSVLPVTFIDVVTGTTRAPVRTNRQPQPPQPPSQHQANVSRLHSVVQSPVFPTSTSAGELSHAVWVPLISRIPRPA